VAEGWWRWRWTYPRKDGSNKEILKFLQTRIRREMSLRLDSQRKSIHDRVAREKAKEEAALKKKRGQKEEEESATPTTPASK
jgi:hypothetical protein